MRRLVVLSNRVKIPDNNPMAGGLAIALPDIFDKNSSIWMGWNGKIIDSNPYCSCQSPSECNCQSNDFTCYQHSEVRESNSPPAIGSTTYITTAFTTEQYQHFYCGFANNVLWPLSHERPDLINQSAQDYAIYQSVNHLFAKQLQKVVHPDDMIWVHDYHFLSVAYYCRKLGMSNRIGFFLHIPFAPLPLWQHLKQSSQLLEQLAYYDVVGTQTQRDKDNCLSVFAHYLKDKLSSNDSASPHLSGYINLKQAVTTPNPPIGTPLSLSLSFCPSHCLTVNTYPIGVNVTKIQQQVDDLSSQVGKNTQPTNLTKSVSQRIIAVDRIDYSKGLLERFAAYGRFLQQHPQYQNHLELTQIACPSRLDLSVYRGLYDTVRHAVHHVNQQFSANADMADSQMQRWQAVTYSEEVLSHKELMRAFWRSDIGWVNSLKDGMNLVAKEYIAAQNPDNPGVLLLSLYAGASEQMQAAIIIDPYRSESVIQGLVSALQMPLSERQRRHQVLLKGLQQNNLQAWQHDFLYDLSCTSNSPQTITPNIDKAV